jgi:hypothetical protein
MAGAQAAAAGEYCTAARQVAPVPAGAHKGQRSKMSNGHKLLPGVSGNSCWARRMRDLVEDHTTDLGGIENVSYVERNLIRRGAALTVQAELLEQQFALESAVDADTVDSYGRITGHLRRLFETLGLARRPKTVGMSLGDLMVEDARRQRAAIENAVDDAVPAQSAPIIPQDLVEQALVIEDVPDKAGAGGAP